MIDEVGAAQMLKPDGQRRKTLGAKDIEEVVAKIARVPVKNVNARDKEVLRNLDADLKSVVFGQDRAIEALASAIKLAAPACAIRKSRSAATCSPGRPASARPRSRASSPGSWASSWSASTCPSTWSATRSRG